MLRQWLLWDIRQNHRFFCLALTWLYPGARKEVKTEYDAWFHADPYAKNDNFITSTAFFDKDVIEFLENDMRAR